MLITLAIIGVVAAMTMPTLIQNVNEQALITRARKAYSVLSQDIELSIIDNGPVEGWDLKSDYNFYTMYIKPYMKKGLECNNESGCWTQTKRPDDVAFGGPNVAGGSVAFVAADGMFVNPDNWGKPSCDTQLGVNTGTLTDCYTITVDVNGSKRPNISGQDVLMFVITQKGLVPAGSDDDSSCSRSYPITCAARVLSTGKIMR